MFIKIDTRSDRRLVKALRELMPGEFAAGHLMASATVIYVDHENPLGILESRLDQVLPRWRSNTSAHTHLQGSNFTKELMLLRVWNLCREQNKGLEALPTEQAEQPGPVELEESPVVLEEPRGTERATLASLYGVPSRWLVSVPLVVKPSYFLADVSEPREAHVRRPERELRDPVRCGRCSSQVEYNRRGVHATYHGSHVADIEWTPVTRFRRE